MLRPRTLQLTNPLMHGPDVVHAQQLLANKGYLPARAATYDGICGPQTIAAFVVAKLALGYPDNQLYATCGPKLIAYLEGTATPPASYVKRAKERTKKPKPGTIQLPANFTPTHETAGLPGYPAIDVFAKAGTIALSPAAGTIDRISGHPPSGHAAPGGPYGQSLYLGPYYLTHFGTLLVKEGQKVKYAQPLGTLVDWETASGGVTPSHIHEGKRAA